MTRFANARAVALALLLAACASGGSGAPASATLADVVRVDAGTLRGVTRDRVVAFLGVPFAAPPVGPLRWRAPQPVAPWSGERAADHVGAMCMQRYNPKDKGVGPLPMSEDCLTLNVFAPAGAHGASLPVMLWIHGGGYVNGSGTAALYDGSNLARQGAVVVAINYRLGRFGFFAHPALSRERADGMLGNYGLLDQVAALRWVQRNVAAFGGDPRNVTIFGESAGGGSVNHLMISPVAQGLFAKAISESGLGRERSATLARAEGAGKRFADSLGVADDVAALRAVPAERILAAGDPTLLDGGGPMIDGTLVTMEVDEAFARGAEARIPYLLGTNSAEFPWAAEGSSMFRGFVEQFTAAERARVEGAYAGHEELSGNLVSDMLFVEPARNLARRHAANGAPTYLYRFAILPPTAPPTLRGAPHASERQYVFETLDQAEWPVGAADTLAARAMSGYWVAFARTGDPNGDARPAWPRFSRESERLLEFTNTGPVVRPVPFAERLDAIAAHFDAAARP